MVENNTNPESKHTLGFTEYADMTTEEFKNKRGLIPMKSNLRKIELSAEKLTEVSSVDWRDQKAVTDVKNQAECGSCWAFSAIETLESHEFLVNKKPLTILSEQELVSCDKTDNGCGGGIMQSAYTWLSTHGVYTEAEYPYTSQTGNSGTCKKISSPTKFSNITGYTMIGNNYTDLSNATAKYPVAIAVDASKWSQLYTGGIFTYQQCGGSNVQLDHGVQVVGFTDTKWLVRNSWGSGWGENGYIYLERLTEDGNTCGLYNNAVIPKF